MPAPRRRPGTKLDASGRVSIPAGIRREKGWEPGQQLFVRVIEGRVTIMTMDEITAHVQAWTRKYIPDDVSLVDELIAERRAAAARGD